MASRILITCSRTYGEWARAAAVLTRAWQGAPGSVLVSGHARRGDQDLERIWRRLGGEVEEHPADWRAPCREGRCAPGHRLNAAGGGAWCPAAGEFRSEDMADLGADLCLAFLAPCVKKNCRAAKVHPSHGAARAAIYAESGAGIRTRRYRQPPLI